MIVVYNSPIIPCSTKGLEIIKLFLIMKLSHLLPIVCLLAVFGAYQYCQASHHVDGLQQARLNLFIWIHQ